MHVILWTQDTDHTFADLSRYSQLSLSPICLLLLAIYVGVSTRESFRWLERGLTEEAETRHKEEELLLRREEKEL